MNTTQSKNTRSTRSTRSNRKFGITPGFVGWLSRSLAVATLAAIGIGGHSAKAVDYNWDPAIDLSNSGGLGTWNTTLTNWNLAGVDSVWGNSATDVAIFGGVGGTVTINTAATGVIANGLTFNVTGYTVASTAGADLLTLAGATPTITVTNVATSATISSIIAGAAGLNTAGMGTLVLSGLNTFTGGVTVSSGTLSFGAELNLGAVANTVTINGGTLQATGIFTSARALTIGASGATLDATAANNVTFSAAITADANALTKTGTGTVTLGAASTRTGTTAVNGGTLATTNIAGTGTGAVTITGAGSTFAIDAGAIANAATQSFNIGLDGTLKLTATAASTLTLTAGSAINLTGATGTVFIGNTLAAGRILAGANQITSGAGSVLAKTGGGVLQLSAANTGFLGGLSIQAGTVEFQNIDSLGTTAKTVTIGGTGDLATAGVTNRNNIVLNAGGTISANAAANYTGTVNVAGAANVALRQYQNLAVANSFTISAPLSGAGNLAVAAPAAATLTLTGNNAAYTGILSAGTSSTVLVSGKQAVSPGGYGLAGGKVTITRTLTDLNTANTGGTAGVAGLNATYYNLGTNTGTAANNLAIDSLYLNQRTFSRTDANVNIPFATGGEWPLVPMLGLTQGTTNGGQMVGMMWKGLLNITNAGIYQFSGQDDDNLVLIIDGVEIGTLGVVAANTNIGAGVALSAGAHSIVVQHTNGGGGGYATLSYNGGAGSDAAATVLIPASAFTTGSLATADIGPVNSTGGGTLNITGPSSTASLTLGNGTLTLSSLTAVGGGSTLDNLTAAGGIINAATPTLAPTTSGLIVTGAIGQDIAGRGLNFAGPYFAEFQGTNTFNGTTNVTGGQLRLNAAGGNSIAGNLTVNAANALGDVANVKLLQAGQIADTATLTMTAGILDMGAFSDTVAGLTLTNGTILGNGGVLTVTGTPTLTAGTIGAGLGGTTGFTKSSTGTVVLAGAGTYTGVSAVTGGILQARGTSALGAGGAGNETTVAAGASLQTVGSANGTENVSIAGTGDATNLTDGALRNLGGVSQIGGLTTTALSTVRVDSGELILNGALNVTLGALTKTGSGTLTFATNQATIPAVTHLAGAIGFSGTQSFGPAAVPAGLAYSFNSNPLAGGGSVSLTVGATSTVIANYAADQAFLAAIAAGSTGTVALTGTNSNSLNFSGTPAVSLGAKGIVNYSGTITPNAGGFRLGGGGGRLNVDSVLAGTAALEITGSVALNAANTFTGTATIKAGGLLSFVNDTSLGTPSNSLVLDGGTLQFNNTADNAGGNGSWVVLGHPSTANGGGRFLTIGAGGGTLDLPARQAQGNFAVIGAVNALVGSGPLTKTGLGMLEIFNTNSYSGAITIAANASRFDLRNNGALPNVASITIENAGRLDVDNNSNLGAARVFVSADNRNRFNDAAPIALNGGTLSYVGRNVVFAAGTPATSQENFGVTTAGIGQSVITSTRTGNGGVDLVISNLVRNVGGGTVNFTAGGNTLGQFGDNPRIILNAVNGVAPALSAFVAGWATLGAADFAAYGANATVGGVTLTATGITNYGSTGAPTYAALTTAATPGAGGFVTGAVGNAAADVTLGSAAGGLNFVVRGLRLGGAATRQILFGATTGTPDTLYVESGGILSDNNNNARNIGVTTNAFTRGRLTAGVVGATTPQELFFHNNLNTFTINSQIIDNPGGAGATVRVVKDLDGAVTLDGANLFSGGTAVLRGTLTANSVGSLGTGGVLVKNGVLNAGTGGVTTGAVGVAANSAVFTTDAQAQIVLTGSGAYTTAGDRFSISAGSNIYANSPGANLGFNSLTRVATPTSFTAGGQIYLAPGAIVRHNVTNAANQGAGTLTIKNLGTNADLFFGPSQAANVAAFNQTLTVGAGTPWAGLSSDRGALTWAAGTIYANSDFTLQGLTANGAIATLNIGQSSATGNTGGNQGGIQFVNNSGGPITASIVGIVAFNEDEPVTMPSNLTLLVTPGAMFQPNNTMSLGFGASQAKVIVQSGGQLDPGNYTQLGNSTNTNRNIDGSIIAGVQNLPNALPSPLNGQVTVESGGRFLINDASGIGSAPIGSYTLKTNSILELGNANAFFGRGAYALNNALPVDTTGLIVPGQFVYEPGVIVRLSVDNVYKVSQFTPTDAVVEVIGANRIYTNNNNPFILVPVQGNPAIAGTVGAPSIAPENLTIGAAGILTNDASDRNLNEGRGQLMLVNGAVIAGSSGTYFNLQEGWNVAAGANITIGSTKYLDGLAKLGAVQLVSPNSNIAGAGASFTVSDGAQLSFNAINVFPNSTPISLPAAVTVFGGLGASATQPGTGSTLLLNTVNFMEYVGHVTGNGTVMANVASTALAMNVTSDFSSNVVFKSTNGQNPSLMKAGPNTLTLTGTSDSTGLLVSQQGEVITSGTGTSNFDEVRPQFGSKITVDNTATATNNRLGTVNFFVGQGGTFELKGNATTPVRETFSNIATGAGNFINVGQFGGSTTIKITPGVATTTLTVQTLENFATAGQRFSSYIINSPSVANGPMTFGIANEFIPNPGNTSNGLLEVYTPNFTTTSGNNAVAFGVVAGGVFGTSGTKSAATLNNFLGDANGDGVPEGFMTEDGVNYVAAGASGQAVLTGMPSTTNLVAGMPVAGTGIPANARILSVVAGVSVTLDQNLTAAAANLNVIVGGMRNLAASEYSDSFRNNFNAGINVKLAAGTTTTTLGDARVSSLTFSAGSTTLNISGAIPLNSTMGRVHLNSGGVFVPSGATATINGGVAGGSESFLQTNGGTALMLHTWGDLNLNAKVFTDIGVVKTGPGTLNVGAGAFNSYRTSLVVDGGTVNFVGANSLPNVRAQNGSTTASHLIINAGTLNLNGNSQMVNQVSSANELPGMGGLITSATPAKIINTGAGRFAGTIGGAISIDKNGNNTWLLTGAQTYTGTTLIRAGTLELRDSAALSASAGAVTVADATLHLNNGYLSNVVNRINPATPVTFSGATLLITGAAGQVASQTFNNLTLTRGSNTFQSNSGGSGATEITIGNLIRPQGPNGNGAFVNFQQNYGFFGTAGNTTTAIRSFINNVNGAPITTNDDIVAGWAVFNGDHFLGYRPATGLGLFSNTADGYAVYGSTDATTALATQNVNDGVARTFTATKTINAWRIAPNAAVTMTLNTGVGLTIDTGGLLTNNNNTTTFAPAAATTGQFITSNSGELDVYVNQNTTNINVPVTGAIDLVKSGPGILVMGAVNTYTGRTIVNGGSLQGALAGADGNTVVSVPGDLHLNAATYTENVANQLKTNANLFISGGARFNAMNAAGITETIASVTFLDATSAAGTANGLDRTALNLTSVLNLSAPTAINATNTNPSLGLPFIGGFIGTVGFTAAGGVGGGSTLNINSPTDINGVLAVGLRFGGRIGNVPTGVPEGGLIKSGTGLLTIDPDQNPTYATTGSTTSGSAVLPGITSTVGMRPGQIISGTNIPANAYIISVDSATQVTMSANAAVAGAVGLVTGQSYNLFNDPSALTDVFNIQSGVVRADRHGSLGSPFANTTVQSGAVLLGTASVTQTIIGSMTLKGGSTLGATLNSFSIGQPTDSAANQTIVNLPSGTVNIAAYDYYVPGTNGGNITINAKLTGAGNISLVGQQLMQGGGNGGTLTLGNPLLSGAGAGQNNYTGTISVGTNSQLLNQIALIAKNTAVVRSTGNALGSATINLTGGRLVIRDDATTGATALSNTAVAFGNNVTLSENSFLSAGRVNITDTNSNNIIDLGTLTVAAGSKVLNVDTNNATTAGAGLGAYVTRFASLDGAGTLIKAGGGKLQLSSIAGTFTGGINIAGPQGITVAPTFNTTTVANLILPTTTTVPAFSVNGLYITEASKTLNVGTFAVNSNPGDLATNHQNVAGRVAVTNSTTITAGTFNNNGVVGPLGGSSTITASTGFTGSGTYVTTNATGGVTSNNPLTLAGNVTAGTLRTAGLNTVSVTGSTNTPAGTEVQSGSLKFAPVANATTTGTITTFGSPASAASLSAAPIAAVTGTLDFAATAANSVTHTGNISNSGIVKVSSGTATVTGTIAGSAAVTYAPGLLEGLITGTGGFDVTDLRPANTGNFGIQMEPRMMQNNSVTQQALTGHMDNEVWAYTGYVKDTDGIFSFAANVDDNAGVWIDGALVLNINGNIVGSTALKGVVTGVGTLQAAGNGGTPSQNFGAGIALPGYGTGWHLIEVRFRNGVGGAGPYGNNGFTTNYGFGYKNGIGGLDGVDYTKPIDNGTGNLFVTPVGSKGAITISSGATLNAGGVSQTSLVTLDAATSIAKLNITAAGASNADAVSLTGGNSGSISTVAASSLTTGSLTIATASTLTKLGAGDLNISTSATLTGNLDVTDGTVNFAAAGTGAGTVTVNTGLGIAPVLNLTGSITGSVTVNDGLLTGNSTSGTTGLISGLTTIVGGSVSPGAASPGLLLLSGGLVFNGGNDVINLNSDIAGTGYDQLAVIGLVTFSSNVPFSLSLGYAATPGTQFTILSNDGVDAIAGSGLFSFAGTPLVEDATFMVGTDQFSISYFGLDSATGNDVVLTYVVPEPGSAILLLGGLGSLLGLRRRRKQA